MLKHTINYTDFGGNKHTKDFYFNLEIDEVAEFRYRKDGSDFSETIAQIMTTENMRGVLDMLREIVLLAVGEQYTAADGSVRFRKDQEAKDALFESGAYSVLFTKMLTDAKFAAKFIQDMLPEEQAKQMGKISEDEDITNLTKEDLVRKMRELQNKNQVQ